MSQPSAASASSLDQNLDPHYATESYQDQQPSNVVFDASLGGDVEAQTTAPNHNHGWSSSGPPRLADHNVGGYSQSFNTSQAWSLSSVCALAWALPPFTSVVVLVWETENDLARFHAYQSGICGVAMVVAMWIVRSVLGLQTIGLLMGMGMFGWFWVCGSTAYKSAPSLSRNPYIAHVGDLASRWVGEE